MKVIINLNNGIATCDGVKVAIVKQASKGANQEYVDIEKLGYSDWQKHIQLKNLVEGDNEVELKPARIITVNKYTLTEEEKEEIAFYQDKINAIIQVAKDRYVPSAKTHKVRRIEDMSVEELEDVLAKRKAELSAISK